MARQILPIAGQIIGGMVGGPVGAAIGGAIGSAVGAYVDPIRHQGPKLGEARAQTAQEGVYRPMVFGTGCVSGNVIHRSPRKVVRHRERVGKGGRDTVDSDRGYRTFAIRIAEAHTPEGYTLLRIWENETLVYDVRPESEIPDESAEYAEKFRFYSGTQDQLPDPDLEAYLGVGNVNSYRGSCYIVFGNFDLTDYGDMVPQYRFEIASAAEAREASFLIALDGSARVSGDGYSWTGWRSLPTSGSYVTAAGLDRFIAHGTNTPYYWSDDGFVTANESLGAYAGGSGGERIGASSIDGNTLMMPEGVLPVTVSNDRGLSFELRGNSPLAINALSHIGGNSWLGIGTYRAYLTTDEGWNWSEVVSSGQGYTFAPRSLFGSGANVMVGGIYDGSACLFRLGASGVLSLEIVPYVSGSEISCAASNHDGSVVCVGTTSGSIVCRINGVWHLANGSFPFPVNDMAFNGRSFLAVARETGRDLQPYLAKISQNGLDWTTVIDDVVEEGDLVTVANPPSAEASSNPISLREVIRFCHLRVGQRLGDFDTSDLTDELDGVVFADGYTARDAITTLLPIYNADASEHDRGNGYRINYIKRGAPVVRTLTIDDMVDEPEETVREDPMERPRVLHMAFESPVTGYTAAKASIQRLSPDVKLVNEVSTYVPVTFKDVNEAWQRADVQMRVAWTEVHGERTFSISDDQLDIVPTDVLALSLRGELQRLRVLKVEYADGVMKLETVADRQSNYTSHVTGIPLPAPEKAPPSLMGPAAFEILDIPAISDQHDRLGYYVAVCGTTEAYAGAVIQRQQNGEWADVVRLGRSQRAIMGALQNTVSAASEHYTDTTNVVSVTLYMDDELESLSDAQWLSEGGAFALETESGWEIMQYRDAYQDSEGVWHLTHLARGRLNTAPAEHLPGSRFVLLDGVRFIDATVGMIGQPLTLRAAAVGRSPETATPETITYQGYSQREFPAANLFTELDGDTLSLQAIPRDRFGTEVHPVRSINHDGFRWSATDSSSTVSLDTDNATATLDVSGLSTPITVTVAQINRFTGAGPTVSEQVE